MLWRHARLIAQFGTRAWCRELWRDWRQKRRLERYLRRHLRERREKHDEPNW